WRARGSNWPRCRSCLLRRCRSEREDWSTRPWSPRLAVWSICWRRTRLRMHDAQQREAPRRRRQDRQPAYATHFSPWHASGLRLNQTETWTRIGFADILFDLESYSETSILDFGAPLLYTVITILGGRCQPNLSKFE